MDLTLLLNAIHVVVVKIIPTVLLAGAASCFLAAIALGIAEIERAIGGGKAGSDDSDDGVRYRRVEYKTEGRKSVYKYEKI